MREGLWGGGHKAVNSNTFPLHSVPPPHTPPHPIPPHEHPTPPDDDDDDFDELSDIVSARHRDDGGVNRLDGVGFRLYRRAVGALSVYHDCLRTAAGPIIASGNVPVDAGGVQMGGDDICDYSSDVLHVIAEAFGKSQTVLHKDLKRFSPHAAILTDNAPRTTNDHEDARRQSTGLSLRRAALARARAVHASCTEAIRIYATAADGKEAYEKAREQSKSLEAAPIMSHSVDYQLPIIYGRKARQATKALHWLEPLDFDAGASGLEGKETESKAQGSRGGGPSAKAIYLFCKRMALFRAEMDRHIATSEKLYTESRDVARERNGVESTHISLDERHEYEAHKWTSVQERDSDGVESGDVNVVVDDGDSEDEDSDDEGDNKSAPSAVPCCGLFAIFGYQDGNGPKGDDQDQRTNGARPNG